MGKNCCTNNNWISQIDERSEQYSANFSNFMNKTFVVFYKFEPRSFKMKCVFMHDYASSHVSKLIRELFEHKIFIVEKIVE